MNYLRFHSIQLIPNNIVKIMTMGLRIYVADVQESWHFIKYKADQNQMVIFADDIVPRWVTTGCVLDYDTICGYVHAYAVLRLLDIVGFLRAVSLTGLLLVVYTQWCLLFLLGLLVLGWVLWKAVLLILLLFFLRAVLSILRFLLVALAPVLTLGMSLQSGQVRQRICIAHGPGHCGRH